jgi:hypothetical protein
LTLKVELKDLTKDTAKKINPLKYLVKKRTLIIQGSFFMLINL